MPGGKQDGIGEFDAADALFCWGEEFLAIEDRVGEVLQDLDVLTASVSSWDIHVPGLWHGEGGFCFHAELAHLRAIALEVDVGAIGDGDAALLGGDFQFVHAGGFTGGSDEGGSGAVVVFHDGGDIVFDFDFVETAKFAEATDLLRHAKKPLEEVQIVRALVHENASALALPGAAPAAGGIVVIGAEPVGDLPVDAADFAQFTAIDEVLQFLEGGVRAHVEHGGEDFALVCVRSDQAFTVGFMNGDGLFHQDMQAGVECFDPDRGVGKVRRADQDGVDATRADHFADIGERMLTLELGWQDAKAFAHRGDAEAWDFT